MRHIFRFFAETDTGDEIYLSGDEFKHLQVIRAEIGDELEIFNGRGHVFTCRLQKYVRQTAVCEVMAMRFVPRPAKTITAVPGIQPATEFEHLLRSLTELHVDRFLVYRHTHDAIHKIRSAPIARWRRILLSACKQAKRAWLPAIDLCSSWGDMLKMIEQGCDFRLALEGGGEYTLDDVLAWELGADTCLVTGSSCGFSEDELADLRFLEVKPVSLGTTVLRAGTAAVFFAGFVNFCRQRSSRCL